MLTESGKFTGNQIVEADIVFRGTIVGDVRVMAPGRFELSGTVTGSVVIDQGAMAIIRGTVTGAVLNAGGVAEVWGTVGAVGGDPPPYISPNAVVG